MAKIVDLNNDPGFDKTEFEEGDAYTNRQSEERASKAKFVGTEKNQENRNTIEETEATGFIRHKLAKKGKCF